MGTGTSAEDCLVLDDLTPAPDNNFAKKPLVQESLFIHHTLGLFTLWMGSKRSKQERVT